MAKRGKKRSLNNLRLEVKKESKDLFNGSRKLNFGHLLFSLGILLVILFTIAEPNQLSAGKGIILLVLGAVVGFLDVSKREAPYFLLASIGLILVSAAPVQVINYFNIGVYLRAALLNMSIFLSLAVVMVSLKIIYRIYLESR